MADTTSARVAGLLSTPLLLLAAAAFAMPFAALPGAAGAGTSGVGFAAAGHAEAAVALLLLAAALVTSLTRRRHRISLLVLCAGFATAALLLLQVRLATAAQDGADQLAAAGGGIGGFGLLGGALQQALQPRWTAAYWAALLAAGAVFAINAWALMRQPEPARAAVPPAAEAPLS